MALFSTRREVDPAGAGAGPPAALVEIEQDPKRAADFFKRAENEGYPIEGRIQYWLMGLGKHSANVESLGKYFDFVDSLSGRTLKLSEVRATFKDSKTPTNALCRPLLDCAEKPNQTAPIFDALSAISTWKLPEVTGALGWRCANVIARNSDSNSAKKSAGLKLCGLMRAEHIYVAEAVIKYLHGLIKGDGEVQDLYRNILAEADAVRNKRGGNFRDSLRDAEAQAALQREGSVLSDTLTRDAMAEARAAYAAEPKKPEFIEALVRRLSLSGQKPDIEEAISILNKAHADLGGYRFRQAGSNLRVRLMRSALDEFEARTKLADASEVDTENFSRARADLLEFRKSEWALRIKEEPTKLKLHLELGQILYDAGEYLESAKSAQVAAESGELTFPARLLQMDCYVALAWFPEAVKLWQNLFREYPNASAKTIERGSLLLAEILASQRREQKDSTLNAGIELCAELLADDCRNNELLAIRAELHSDPK